MRRSIHRSILLISFSLAACAGGPLPRELDPTTSVGATTDASTTITRTDPAPWSTTGWGVGLDLPPIATSTADPTTGAVASTTAETSTGAQGPALELAALRVIEVLADPEGKDGGGDSPEFVELLHVGPHEISLAGLVLAVRGWPELRAGDLGLAEATLAPGQRLLLQRYASGGDLPIPAVILEDDVLRVVFADSGGLRNSDGGVLVRDPQGNPGDLMIYGAPQPEPWDEPDIWLGPPLAAAASGKSLCRPDPLLDTDTPSDWQTCDPTPGTLPEPPPEPEPQIPADLVIVEVLSNPPGPGSLEKNAEFVEVLNLGPGELDLAGWTIHDSTLPEAPGGDPLLYHGGDGGCAPETCLAPGRKALLVGDAYQGPIGDALVLKTDDSALANAGLGNTEAVVVRDAEGQLRSSYRAWPDPLVAPDPATMEAALIRAPDAPDDPSSWTFAAPTPGL